MTQQELQEFQNTFTQFKEANDQALAEMRRTGTVNSELQAKVGRVEEALQTMETRINARMDDVAKAKSLQDRIDQLEAMLARKGTFTDPNHGEPDRLKSIKAAFFKALRSGVDATLLVPSGVLNAEEFKSLTLSPDTAGGYLAPGEFVTEMLANVVEWSALRNICRVRTTTRPFVQIPKRTTTATASWTAATATRSETTNPAFALETITPHEMYAMTKVGKQDLEDSAFDLEAFLRAEFAEQFGLSEGTAFISGSGIGQPEGILTNSAVSYTVSGDADEITADGLIALYYDLKEPYLQNASWVMNRASLKKVRQLKETATGQYVWAPGIKTEARPATLLDRPYLTCPDMPSEGAGTFPVVFGDFRRAVIIVDRVQMEMMTDPYASKSTGMVEFSARKRVGGQVVLAEAIRKLKCST